MKLCLFQPDIPQNAGAAMRLCACLGIGLDIIEPCGFPWDERKIQASALDYRAHVTLTRYSGWAAFLQNKGNKRLVLMTTKAATPYTDFSFRADDLIMAGRESAGVPEDVHAAADNRILIPLSGGMRSLNVINASAMILGEALRQTQQFPARPKE
jgi:tRNA (cytidine/uridine-2'-O-)-methyltransferase